MRVLTTSTIAVALLSLGCGRTPPADAPAKAVAAARPITDRDWHLISLGENTDPKGSGGGLRRLQPVQRRLPADGRQSEIHRADFDQDGLRGRDGRGEQFPRGAVDHRHIPGHRLDPDAERPRRPTGSVPGALNGVPPRRRALTRAA